jgi:lipid II:glycine glycyltransferase (peptidoglycan interpeptide bridge formation enzyme)
VYTNTPPGQDLRDGLVFSDVDSWLTGRRIVSLPFSDHCDPLVLDHIAARTLFASVMQDCRQLKYKYVEVRPREGMDETSDLFVPVQTHYHHDLDLTPDLDSLFSKFHKNCVQRKIKRAEQEGLLYVEGRSEKLVDHFYQLLLLTRRRHHLPPQPKKWFQNLTNSFGEALKIRIAYKNSIPVASILTLQYKDTLTYKSGCSDSTLHNLGGMHLLFWKSIQDAKAHGLRVFDLGRSETSNTGLTIFKDRWGATRTSVSYYNYFNSKVYSAKNHSSKNVWKLLLAKQVFRHLPGTLLSSAGNLLYRHIG